MNYRSELLLQITVMNFLYELSLWIIVENDLYELLLWIIVINYRHKLSFDDKYGSKIIPAFQFTQRSRFKTFRRHENWQANRKLKGLVA